MTAIAIWLLGLALVVVLALAFVALLIPVKLGLTVRTSPGWRLQIAVRLLGGLAPPITVHDSARRRPGRKAPEPESKMRRARSGPIIARVCRAAVAAPRIVAGLLRPIHLDRLTVDADIGLPDPADTGRLFGLLASVTHSRLLAPAVSIEARPDFRGPRTSGELNAVLSFVPAAFIPPGIRFAWQVFGARR